MVCAVIAAPQVTVAQAISDCDWRSEARFIVEPWEENSRSFANGNVRLTRINAREPVPGPLYLMVQWRSDPVTDWSECRLIGWTQAQGFAQLEFAALSASYDPAKGLTFTLPGLFYLEEEGFSNSVLIALTLNRATNKVSVEAALGIE